MPHCKNAIKALRQNHKKHMHNLDIKTEIKKTVKKFQDFVAQKNKNEAVSTLRILFKKFDKAVKTNLFHRNTASRRKSRFSRLLKNIA